MKRVLAAAVSAALLAATMVGWSATSDAQSPAGHKTSPQTDARICLSSTDWQQLVKIHSEGVSILKLSDIDGMQAKLVVARVNATPPVTNLVADHVIVLGARALADKTPSPYVLVAFFNRGCLVASGRADPTAVAKMIGGGESI